LIENRKPEELDEVGLGRGGGRKTAGEPEVVVAAKAGRR